MATENGKTANHRRRPALAPEMRENQIINGAVNLAEEKIANGTASSQIIQHYLKLAAEKEKRDLENELIRVRIELEKAKIKAIERDEEIERKYEAAIMAMKEYSGNFDDEEETDGF